MMYNKIQLHVLVDNNYGALHSGKYPRGQGKGRSIWTPEPSLLEEPSFTL